MGRVLTIISCISVCTCTSEGLKQCNKSQDTSLHDAVASEDIPRVRMLINQKYDPNAVKDGKTPLHIATQQAGDIGSCSNMYYIMHALIMAGAHCKGAGCVPEEPLVTAAKQASVFGVKLLLMFGAPPRQEVKNAVAAPFCDADEDAIGGPPNYDDGKQKQIQDLLDHVRNNDIGNIPSRIRHLICVRSGHGLSCTYMIGPAEKCKIALGQGDIGQARQLLRDSPSITGLDIGNMWRHTAQLYSLDDGTDSQQFEKYMNLLESKMDRSRLFTTIRNSTPEQYHALRKVRPEWIWIEQQVQANV